MAANVVVTEKEWRVLGPILARLGEGGILVPPNAAKDFKQSVGKEVPNDVLVEDYDFGGQADVVIDVMHSISGFAADAIIKHLKDNPDE